MKFPENILPGAQCIIGSLKYTSECVHVTGEMRQMFKHRKICKVTKLNSRLQRIQVDGWWFHFADLIFSPEDFKKSKPVKFDINELVL